MSFRAMLCLVPLLLTGGCKLGWQYLEVENVSYRDLFVLTSHVIDSEGFVLDEQNTNTGSITTRWNYGKLIDVGRFPIRRRAEAQIDPLEEGKYQLKLRIPQQALWENYGVVNPETAKGWELYGDDKETTHSILTRIKLMVQDFEPSEDFLDRMKRIDKLRDTTPEVLK